MPERGVFPHLNEIFDVKHIAFDLTSPGIKDPQVYKIAIESGRILATRNDPDFHSLIKSDDPGIIAMPPHLRNDQVDIKLMALLKKHRANYFKGKIIALGQEEL